MALVSFRVSEEEKRLLRLAAVKEGFKNLTDFMLDVSVVYCKEEHAQDWEEINGAAKREDASVNNEGVRTGEDTDRKEQTNNSESRADRLLRTASD